VVTVSPSGSIGPGEILGPGAETGPNDDPSSALEDSRPLEGAEASNGTESVSAVDDSETSPQTDDSNDASISEMPELRLFDANGVPADFIDPLTLSDDSDNHRQRGPAAKFLYDTMRVLSDVLEFEEFEEFSLKNVNLDNELLWQALDAIERQMSGMDNPDDIRAAFMVQIATGSGVALTAGYVAWILRGGMLASMLISSMPMWKGFDPLPLLAARKRKRSKKDDEEEARRKAEADDDGTQAVEALLAAKQTMQGRS